ncbi:hypothetical protein TNCT_551631 [Trichonephila clavata]|uniref:Uncharacterized protein n=1 Tax=Trichonephila clavata TaxID=2740835 RepID=A0A8X6LPL3_TRICU|nr:hypothetical protein TNCT_551631 [Trichonephila clavata]
MVVVFKAHKCSKKNPRTEIDKKNRLQRSPNGLRNNSSSGRDREDRLHSSPNGLRNNSSSGMGRKNGSRNNSRAGIDNKSGDHHQNSPKRSRNISSTRKEDHVITGIIYPISGAVPVPVIPHRRRK